MAYYENNVRNGFAIGEVKAVMMSKGYSEEESVEIGKHIRLITATKNNERESTYRHFIGASFPQKLSS